MSSCTSSLTSEPGARWPCESVPGAPGESKPMPSQSGIPSIERWVRRILIGRCAAATRLPNPSAILREQQHELVSLVETAGAEAITRVQIRRLPGLEHSSTNYSLAMVVDHLARVNRDLATTLESLAQNQPGTITVVIANYKPDPGAQPQQATQYTDARSPLVRRSARHHLGVLRTIPSDHPP